MLPKNTLGKVILFDDPPTDEDAKKWEPGTIFMHIMTTPPTLYMVTWSDDLERVLQQIGYRRKFRRPRGDAAR